MIIAFPVIERVGIEQKGSITAVSGSGTSTTRRRCDSDKRQWVERRFPCTCETISVGSPHSEVIV